MISKRTAWWAVGTGAAMLGGFAVQLVLDRAWQLARDEDPPLDPGNWDVDWRDAVVWTVATGVVMGLGRLLARRGAAYGWEVLLGEHPPV